MTDAWHTHFVKYRRSCYSPRRYASHGTTRQKIVGACGGVAHILIATTVLRDLNGDGASARGLTIAALRSGSLGASQA